MEAFNSHSGTAVCIDRANIDTDAIIPKQFLKRIERSGFGQFLFYDWRYLDDGTLNTDFILNQEPFSKASILIARDNFGCGSSREHAPWALSDYGFRVIIAPSFADIFYNNSLKNGILPIVLPVDIVETLFIKIGSSPDIRFIVDLEHKTISDDTGMVISFSMDDYQRHLLMEGLDDIDLTLKQEEKITEYERRG